MCSKDDKKETRLKDLESVYKLSIDTRNFETNQLINRKNFIMLFQGVLLAAVFQNQASKPVVGAIICICGIFVSAFQVMLSSGAKYWQEFWELKTEKIEEILKIEHGEDRFIALLSKGNNEKIDPCKECERKRRALYIWIALAVLLISCVLCINNQTTMAACLTVASIIIILVSELCLQCQNPETKEAPKPSEAEVTPQDMEKKILKGSTLNPAGLLIYRKYSVSKIPVYVGLTLVATWSALAIHSFGVDYYGIAKGHVIKSDNYREDTDSSYRKAP